MLGCKGLREKKEHDVFNCFVINSFFFSFLLPRTYLQHQQAGKLKRRKKRRQVNTFIALMHMTLCTEISLDSCVHHISSVFLSLITDWLFCLFFVQASTKASDAVVAETKNGGDAGD